MTFNDDMQKGVDRSRGDLLHPMPRRPATPPALTEAMYGNNLTMSTFKSILKDTVLASHYQQDYIDSLTYTDEEVAGLL